MRLRRVLGRLGLLAPDAAGAANPLLIGWAVSVVGRRVLGAPCLAQALAGEVMLRRRGQAAEVRIGVARSEDGRLLAHAWLESRGRVVVGGADTSSYAVLA
jgi:hypothetical protein